MAVEEAFPELPKGAFTKQDTGDDLAFYALPRLVTHIDEGALTALTDFYRTVLPVGGQVLYPMSSWVSQLQLYGHARRARGSFGCRRMFG